MINLINPVYQSKDFFQFPQKYFHEVKGIRYMVLDDFIEPSVWRSMAHAIYTSVGKIIMEHKEALQHTHDVFYEGKQFIPLHHFFYSTAIEKYFSGIFRKNIQREFLISQDDIVNRGYSKEAGIIVQTYKKGDFYDWHLDGSATATSFGAFIYYVALTKNYWNEEDGGLLVLGNPETQDIYQSIIPKENRMILLFYSPLAWHKVTPVLADAERISIQSTLLMK